MLKVQWIAYAVSFISAYAMPATVPVLPALAEEFAMPESSMGLLMAAFTLPCILLTPLFGILADRVSPRLILLPCILLYGAGGFACGTAQSLEALLLWRMVQGAGGACLGLLNTTLLGGVAEGMERSRFMGRTYVAICAGVMFFTLLAGWAGGMDWRYAFWVPSLFTIPLFLACLLTRLPSSGVRRSFPDCCRGMAEALRSRRVLAVLGISFINIGVNMGAVMTFFPGYAHLRFGTPSSGLGMCYGLSALGMLAGSLFVARNRRFPPFTVIRAAALLSAGGIALMPFLPSFWALLVPLWLCSLQDGAIRPCLSAVMAGLGGREQRSAVMSLDVTVFRLSQSLSPLLFGGALELAGYGGVFLGGAAALLLLVLLVLPAQGGRP